MKKIDYIHFDSIIPWIPKYHRHALPIRSKGKQLQQLKLLLLTPNPNKRLCLVRLDELIIHQLGRVNQRDLVRRRTLVNHLAFLILLGYHLVCQSQSDKIILSELSLSFERNLVVSLSVSHYDLVVECAVS